MAVERPKAVGTKTDKAKETVSIRKGNKRLFSILCENEDTREDPGFGEFELGKDENDDDGVSIMSSRAGSIANDGEFDGNALQLDSETEENDNHEMSEEALESGLKLLGNVKRRKMSPLIHKDLLGVDGQVATVGMKKTHTKVLAREESKLFMMRVWNRHFDRKMEKRMEQLTRRQQESKSDTYKTYNFEWRDVYGDIMRNLRDTAVKKS